MPSDQQLSDVLSEFARTMLTDFPIQSILDRLVHRIVDILPVTAAGVTLISPGAEPRYVAASNESALRFEQLQTALGEGPCVVAYESGEAVAVSDLRGDGRFPRFGPMALDAGLVAVFTFPLRQRTQRGSSSTGWWPSCARGRRRTTARTCVSASASPGWSRVSVTSLDDVMHRADHAMYEDKHAQRDHAQVVITEDVAAVPGGDSPS